MNSIRIAAPQNINTVYKLNGYNSDIIKALNSQFPLAVSQTVSAKFSGDNLQEKGRAIYNYLRDRVKYEKDKPGSQVIKLPSRLIHDVGAGDCKSLALAAAAFMYNNGFNNVRLRYASYNDDVTPSHVYAVAENERGEDIIIDPVYKYYNREPVFKSFKDYPMKIEVLSGPPVMAPALPKKILLTDIEKLNLLKRKLRPGTVLSNIVSNEILRRTPGSGRAINYSPDQLRRYLWAVRSRQNIENEFLRAIIKNEIDALQSGTFTGNIVSFHGNEIAGLQDEIGKLSLKKIRKQLKKISPRNLWKGVKAVGLVAPRKAILALIAVNARGLATRMSRLSDQELRKFWDKFGGQFSVLKRAVTRGKKRRPLFNSSKKIKQISGFGFIEDDSIGEGAPTPGGDTKSIDISSLIQVAAPILKFLLSLLKSKGSDPVPESGAAPGEDSNFSEANSFAMDSRPGINDYFNQAIKIAESTGIIPDRPETAAESKVNQAIPVEDETDDAPRTSFKINPLVLVGAAGAVYILTSKK